MSTPTKGVGLSMPEEVARGPGSGQGVGARPASFLWKRGHNVQVASYGERLIVAAESIGLTVTNL